MQATSGNLVIAGNAINNRGNLTANKGTTADKGTVSLTTGSKLRVGWDEVTWLEGVHTSSTNHLLQSSGNVQGNNVTMEAHRNDPNTNSIFNNGKISAADKVTFVTGLPGIVDGLGNYTPGKFGVANTDGKIFATTVVISPYYQAAPGGKPTDRPLTPKNTADKAQLEIDLGGKFFGPTQDNTPAGTSAVVNDTFSPTTSTAGTSAPSIVIPQLAVSMTHMNASTAGNGPIILAKNQDPETVRGSANKAAPAQKPRVKAKPVLMRGSFFDSKIKAKITVSG